MTGVILSRRAPTPEVDAQLDELIATIRVYCDETGEWEVATGC